jgi:hypothetical protein
MNGIKPSDVLIVGVMIVIASWAGFYKIFLKRKIENHDKNRKTHEEKVVDVISRFMGIKIEYLLGREFSVSLQVLDDLKDKKSYRWTRKHLESYEVIWGRWKDFEEGNKQLNLRLKKLKDYIFDKISNELGEKYKKCLSYPLWAIVKYAIEGDVKKINIEMNEENGGRHLRVGLTGRPAVSIPLKDYNMNKIKNFLVALQRDDEFNNKVVFLLNAHNKLKGIISQIANELDVLLEDIDNKFELKGKCGGCPSFWKE